jgi:UDP-glucose 4-epimerase
MWETVDCSKYETIIHCAALVHQDSRQYSLAEYKYINAELTEKVAAKAKKEGLPYFIFMSIEGVYGTTGSCYRDIMLDQHTKLQPIEKYEISKKIAEDKLLKLQNENHRLFMEKGARAIITD